jgi:hypothetical protein
MLATRPRSRGPSLQICSHYLVEPQASVRDHVPGYALGMGNRLLLQIVEHRAGRAVADVRDTGASDLHGREDTVRRDQLPIAEPLRLKIAHGFVIVLAFER